MKRLFTLFLLMAIFGMTNSNAKNRAGNIEIRLDSLMKSLYGESSPGAALLIANGDKIIYDKGFGIADMATKAAIDGNTNFNIASVSKQFTDAGILWLQQEGLLSIDDPVAKFFPEFKSDIWKRITLKHLMSHSSGVPDIRPRTDKNFTLYATDKQSVEYMKDLDSLKFEPGTQYDYINPTLQLISFVIERVSKMPFEEFQRKYIFTPSKMKNVCYFSPERHISNMAHGYILPHHLEPKNLDRDTEAKVSFQPLSPIFSDNDGVKWQEYDYGEETFFATKADGGIYTSTHELYNWEKALESHKTLSAESLNLAYSPITKVTGSKFSAYQNRPYTFYGLGWFQDYTPNRPVKVYHTGDNGGFQAYVAKYLGTKVVVIMLENRNDHDRWKVQMQIEKMLIEEGLLDLK